MSAYLVTYALTLDERHARGEHSDFCKKHRLFITRVTSGWAFVFTDYIDVHIEHTRSLCTANSEVDHR